MSNGTNRTHIKDVEKPDKVLLPSSDLVLITLRKGESGHCIPFAPLNGLPLHLGHGPAIETSVSGSLRVCVCFR